LDARERHKRSVMGFPVGSVLGSKLAPEPTRGTSPAEPPIHLEKGAGDGATIAHDMNEKRVRENLAQEPDAGPAGDLDQQPLSGPGEVLRKRAANVSPGDLRDVGCNEVARGTAEARVERIPVAIGLTGVGIPGEPGSERRIVQRMHQDAVEPRTTHGGIREPGEPGQTGMMTEYLMEDARAAPAYSYDEDRPSNPAFRSCHRIPRGKLKQLES